MRGLQRPSCSPPTLRETGSGGRAALRHREQRTANPKGELYFTDHWNRPDVRGALFAMQGWVCAYCQCEIALRDGGDVDHFRPTSGSRHVHHDGYWWLAYRFDNHLLSCRRCNEHIKRDQFPVRGTARATPDDVDPEARELRLLLDPARDPVDAWLRIDLIDERCAVRPPRDGDPEDPMRERVEETARLFRLNEDLDLVQARERARAEVILAECSTPGGASRLRVHASRYRAWSATWREALRTFAHDVALPAPDEELRWLLDDLLARIDTAWKLMDLGQEAEVLRRRLDEIGWTIAFLWHDPPTGSPEDVKQWVQANKLTEWVEPLLKRLT